MFALVVSNTSEIGVDLELCQDRRNLAGIVEKCFSVAESSYWNSLPDELKTRMFFRFWVRKEAFVKAVGRGIALGLNYCEIDTLNQDRFLTIPDSYGLASDWKIINIPFGGEGVCAVVMKNQDFRYKQTRL
jgi:4'-phosphopantetheinyl transferase